MIESCSIQEQIVLCTMYQLTPTFDSQSVLLIISPYISALLFPPHDIPSAPDDRSRTSVTLLHVAELHVSCTWLGFSVQYIYSSISIRSSVVNSPSGPIWALLTDWLPKYDILGGRTGRHDMAMILVGRFWGLAKSSRDEIQSKYLKDAIKPLIFYYCYRKKLLVLHSAVTHICPF